MDALDEDKGKGSSRKPHERKQKVAAEPKERKEKTWELSYRLYREGKKVDEIAKERSLTQATIISHLSRYVRDGKISISALIDEKKIPVISRAIADVRSANADSGSPLTLTAVKELCPDNISYEDIRLVLEGME